MAEQANARVNAAFDLMYVLRDDQSKKLAAVADVIGTMLGDVDSRPCMQN